MDNKFRVAIGHKYNEHMMNTDPLAVKNVTGIDFAVFINLFEVYGDDKAAMVISKEST